MTRRQRVASPRFHAVSVVLVIAAAVIAPPRPAWALDPAKDLSGCSLRIWRVRDGLPGVWVKALAQTPDGYLWVGALGGLARLDGAQMTNFSADRRFPRPGDISDLLVQRDGTLWVKLSDGAVICRRDGVFRPCLDAGRSGLPRGRVLLLHEDPQGQVWITSAHGIHRAAGETTTLIYPAQALPFETPAAIQRDRRGRLWAATSTGLYRADPPAAFERHAGPQGPITAPVGALFEGGSGQLWAAGPGTLVQIDVTTGATLIHPGDGFAELSRPKQLVEDGDGNVWIGGPRGLTRFRDGRFRTFDARDGLPEGEVSSLFEDREGSLWIGTRFGGLAQLSDRTLATGEGPPSLRDARVESVAEAADGTFWFGRFTGGVTRWRPDGGERTFGVADGLPSDKVMSVLPAPDGSVWVGTDRGLLRWRGDRPEGPVLPVRGLIAALYLDRAARLWVGSEDGLWRLVGERLEPVPPEEGFAPAGVRAIQQDAGGTVWAAADHGLARVDQRGRLARVRGPGGVVLNNARAMHADREGTLWLGTIATGLWRIKGGELRVFTLADGLPFDRLFQLTSDDQGFLWVGTSRGIVRLDKAALDQVARGARARVDPVWFDAADHGRDVAATRSRQPGVWAARDGRLWFATDQGMITIHPRRLRLETAAPPVWIEELSFDGQPARRAERRQRFPPGAGNLHIQFAAVTLIEPHKVAHRYRLVGFDERWVDAGTRRAAYYTNLPPGRYRFQVQARNADGVWNQRGDSVEILLAPHFHQTRWFYGACALAVMGLGLTFHRVRVGQVRRRYRAVLAERGRVARELHDSSLQGMSAVAMQLYGLRKRPGAASVADDLAAIERVVVHNLEETRRYVWNLRAGGRSGGLGAALGEVIDRLGESGASTCRLVVEGTPVPLPEAVEEDLVRIAGEALANAHRHAQASVIEVRLRYHQDGGVQLTVFDDGRGFTAGAPPGPTAGHFGLVGMRERAARLGPLTITSAPGQGTSVEVTVARETASRDV